MLPSCAAQDSWLWYHGSLPDPPCGAVCAFVNSLAGDCAGGTEEATVSSAGVGGTCGGNGKSDGRGNGTFADSRGDCTCEGAGSGAGSSSGGACDAGICDSIDADSERLSLEAEKDKGVPFLYH